MEIVQDLVALEMKVYLLELIEGVELTPFEACN